MALSRIKILGAILLLATLIGCAVHADVVYLQKEISVLNNKIRDLQGKCELNEDEQSLRMNMADMGESFDNLRGEIKRLQGLLAESQHYAKKMTQRVDSIELESTLRLSQIEDKLTDMESRVDFLEKHLSIKRSKRDKKSSSGEQGTEIAEEKKILTKSHNNDRELLYQSAYENLKKGMVESARKDFKIYLERYPQTELSDNAQYWLGECFYVEGKYEDAILEFDKVIQNYPKGDKVKSALLKEGLAFYGIRDYENAKIILKKIIKDYPHSPQAEIAKKRLKGVD